MEKVGRRRVNKDLEQTAIMRLREAADTSERFYKAPLIVTTSGGKDSSVCVALAEKAGIDFEVIHNHTTVDAPETVYFVRSEFKRLEGKGIKCTVNYPYYKGERVTMWSLIPQKLMPPTRLVRYCCSILKERGGQGRYITTGVRWAESVKRKNNRGIYETIPSDPKKKIVLNNDNDDRRRLFETCMMLEERKRRGKMQGTWREGTTGRDIFHWWMEDGVLPGQMEFDDLLLEEDEEW